MNIVIDYVLLPEHQAEMPADAKPPPLHPQHIATGDLVDVGDPKRAWVITARRWTPDQNCLRLSIQLAPGPLFATHPVARPVFH